MADQKDTIYIDVDDEITAIIDKVQDSSAKIVALVLPKRAAALQSIVNMKLLKRSADDAGKHVVLITSETALLPLAGAVGLYAAKTLQSKPEVPAAPESADELAVDEAVDIEETAKPDAEETVELDDEKEESKTAKPKGKKGPKVPDFEKFRLKLFLIIGGVIGLIALWYFAVVVSPSAKVVISANSEDVNTTLQFTASTTANSVNAGDKIVPAQLADTDKEETQKTTATGTKDASTKATGTITVKNCASSTPPTLSAGNKFASSSGKVFTNDEAFTPAPATVSGGTLVCGSSDVAVTATDTGDSYNIAATSYTNDSLDTGYTLSGGAMDGGSSKTVTVVSQQDVDTAKGKMSTSDDSVKAELKSQLEEQGYFAIEESFEKSDEKTVASPKVGQEASEVSVTYSATYSMLGVKRDDMKQLLTASIKDQIDPDRQEIQDDGLDQATFTIKSTKSDGSSVVTVSTIVAVGPNIDTDKLKSDIAGQKNGEAENIIKALPGVQDVTVDYSPFWVNKAPKNPDKITVEINQAE